MRRALRDNRVVPVLALSLLVRLPTLGAQRTVAPTAPARDEAPPRIADSAFAATVVRLSEPPGFFDTDNLISNESSYLHVLPRLRALGVRGGAYLGVGPDQNYSYIAAIRPRVAYILDVRRDNLLQHLMFKSLFAQASNRMEFLCLWLGRTPPARVDQWNDRSIADIVRYVDNAPRDEALARRVQGAIVRDAMATGVPLRDGDRAILARFHGEFVREGLELRFTSYGRAPRASYPTLRDLVLARDTEQRQGSYLVREDDWRFVKSMHAANRIIPAVGSLGGPRALAAIARDLAEARESVSAFYTSNVEFYLWGDGSFERFARNVAALPRDSHSVIIRSYFGRQFGDAHPLAVAGFGSVQLLQPLSDFVARWRGGGWESYRALVNEGAR